MGNQPPKQVTSASLLVARVLYYEISTKKLLVTKGIIFFTTLSPLAARFAWRKCLDLGSDGVSLDFRESALLVGSHVTCVGQAGPRQAPSPKRVRWSKVLLGRSLVERCLSMFSLLVKEGGDFQGC